jgi:hypothetical protein
VSRAKLALGVPLALAADVALFSMLRRARPKPVGLTVIPPAGFEHHERAVVVAGQERRLPVVSHGGYEALRFAHGGLVVTAVARSGFSDRPAFDVIEDLEPYLAEHRRFIHSWLRFWRG